MRQKVKQTVFHTLTIGMQTCSDLLSGGGWKEKIQNLQGMNIVLLVSNWEGIREH